MRLLVEDVEYYAIPHPLDGLAIIVSHVSKREAVLFEEFVPLESSAQQVAQVVVRAFERVHPERRSRPAT